uniref:DNA-binding protein n=1 Tax=Heterorhabditis bacteriophora TaxID=37862 RepID=A0A1I7XPU4_HETBA
MIKQFTPYGLSSYQSKGRISLYVVNANIKRQCVELFYYNKDRNILIHRKAVCDQRFSSLVDIAVVGADRFFVTNIAYFASGKIQLLEFTMQTNFGSLFYYDGHTVIQIESRLPTPSAISVDHKRNLLYIASLLNENVRVYALQKDLSLVYRTEMALLSSPTGIHVDEESGDLWISLHPVIYLAYLHSLNPADDKLHSPSQILRVRIQEDGVSWVITEPYANDGATITASSDVVRHFHVYYKEQLLIGSQFGRLVHCDVLNPSIT